MKKKILENSSSITIFAIMTSNSIEISKQFFLYVINSKELMHINLVKQKNTIFYIKSQSIKHRDFVIPSYNIMSLNSQKTSESLIITLMRLYR
jgi:hypothetical protein